MHIIWKYNSETKQIKSQSRLIPNYDHDDDDQRANVMPCRRSLWKRASAGC